MKQVTPPSGYSGSRFLLIAAAFCVVLAMVVRWPGSVPHGWQYSSGDISSAVGKVSHGAVLYYPTIQYLALGYSYDMPSQRGLPVDPVPGTGNYAVAFNPEHPEQAKLVGETPPNYFAVLFPAMALVLLAIYARASVRAIVHSLLGRLQARVTAKLAAELAAAEAAKAAVATPVTSVGTAEAEPALGTTKPNTELHEEESTVTELVAEVAEQTYAPMEMITPDSQESPETPAAINASPAEAEATVTVAPEAPRIAKSKKPKPKTKKAAPKPPASAPKSIYIPKVESSAEPPTDKRRSAAELKTKLKTPKPKVSAARKKPTATKPAAKKSRSKAALATDQPIAK